MERREVFLNAGDFFFYRPDTHRPVEVVVRTLLGSCVSVVLWSPERKIGGMCHCVLPTRPQNAEALDGNHCEGALERFRRELLRTGTRPQHYQAYVIGGARMSMGLRNAQKISVGDRNIEVCRRLLNEAGFTIRGEHVGLSGPRRVHFNLATGCIDVLHANRLQTLTA